ncbi:class A beta-lactamase-related serine hydrolase [Patescibacteria group bacterium]|nr:class A beta-lactamase-related serine hydrolase [Patescibacteria group bacterium]
MVIMIPLGVALLSLMVMHGVFAKRLTGMQNPLMRLRTVFQIKKPPQELRAKVEQIIGGKWSLYSVYVRDLTSDFSMGINESAVFTAASLNKVPILAVVYSGVEKGTIDLNRTITLQEEDIQDYGTGSIRYDPPGTMYTVRSLLQDMIEQSDNTAAYLLAHYVVGMDAIQREIDSWGLTQTSMAENTTSNKDMAVLFMKLYKGELADGDATEEMLGFLRETDFHDRLPGLLPDGVTVYHKIGTAVGSIHDAGIVVHGNTRYYIGVLTGNVTDESDAAQTTAAVSKAVYDFMTESS